MRATQSRTQTWPVNQGRGQGVFGENACLGHSGRGTERRDRREPGLAALKSVYILALRNQVRMSWMVGESWISSLPKRDTTDRKGDPGEPQC